MEPENHSLESRQPETAASTPTSGGEANGKNGEHRIWPFEEPPPPRLTPEEIQELLKLWSEEDEKQAEIDLREMLEGRGGISSEEFLRAIEKAALGDG